MAQQALQDWAALGGAGELVGCSRGTARHGTFAPRELREVGGHPKVGAAGVFAEIDVYASHCGRGGR